MSRARAARGNGAAAAVTRQQHWRRNSAALMMMAKEKPVMTDALMKAAGLRELQAYVAKLEVERGFSHQSAVEKCLLLGEEVGELFKAVRKQEGMPIEPGGVMLSIGGELADLLIYLCAIANRYDIDLDQAFRDKERLNATRRWIASAPA
ncbi:NTP pyrophosphatase (non-canonical NTP hydrolase) [Rhizobium sp. SG_E_25_P2]|uniref:MazG nucleotide pyrophosphohydrolase domain-containing protein n=1 Tax=Rhizobium sp. SG_E_25_P2 TaxID=2879942 RepID=UPI002476EE28|nr:MazG nucleotide pyrophosphohydrolase domain-containing protein [Rhizobium sp. SG_E_25_P2]MDH6269873.1 NTP pyrophosphatase (non-canonical NTP hydrolase) [Rhizobium sp. SG_E_25_P2]